MLTEAPKLRWILATPLQMLFWDIFPICTNRILNAKPLVYFSNIWAPFLSLLTFVHDRVLRIPYLRVVTECGHSHCSEVPNPGPQSCLESLPFPSCLAGGTGERETTVHKLPFSSQMGRGECGLDLFPTGLLWQFSLVGTPFLMSLMGASSHLSLLPPKQAHCQVLIGYVVSLTWFLLLLPSCLR